MTMTDAPAPCRLPLQLLVYAPLSDRAHMFSAALLLACLAVLTRGSAAAPLKVFVFAGQCDPHLAHPPRTAALHQVRRLRPAV